MCCKNGRIYFYCHYCDWCCQSSSTTNNWIFESFRLKHRLLSSLSTPLPRCVWSASRFSWHNFVITRTWLSETRTLRNIRFEWIPFTSSVRMQTTRTEHFAVKQEVNFTVSWMPRPKSTKCVAMTTNKKICSTKHNMQTLPTTGKLVNHKWYNL